MAQIPSNIAVSSLQAGYQSGLVSGVQEKEQAAQSGAALRQAKASNLAGETVGVEDEDTAVFADSQGAGSQGRAPEEGDGEAPDSAADAASDPLPPVSQAEAHLDLQA